MSDSQQAANEALIRLMLAAKYQDGKISIAERDKAFQ